jgi:dienelactone hydrolase
MLSARPAAAAAPRVLEPGKIPDDARLGKPRNLRDKFHPWTPPATLAAWETEKAALRERLLVSQGLWPMPPFAPLAPVIHGKIDRDDYTIEKVFFASLPGHYVSGNLYRPKKIQGKIPAVLMPHGHWPNGRFFEFPADKAQKESLDIGAEKFMAGARYPLQARAVQLARMGCTVFHYDMIGYADSKPLSHWDGFADVEGTLRLQQAMGLQTINSIRSLDFLVSLPEVDPARIGVTGASGGGTQTFVLCALDPRPAAAFPAVMVSTDMQGGCVCENCCYLRIGINNVAFAAMFAPRPMAMSCANDWTRHFETTGYPELKQVYALYGAVDQVKARTWPEFGHNYNQPAREMMYAWFNRHLKIGLTEPIEERDFVPVVPNELSVFDAEHPRPKDALDVTALRAWLTRTSNEQFAALVPKDAEGLTEYRRIVGAAARVMLDSGVPAADDVPPVSPGQRSDENGYHMFRVSVTRRDQHEQVPVIVLVPAKFGGTGVLWLDGAGTRHLFDADGRPTDAVRKLFEAGLAVISADLFQTGEYLAEGASPPAPVVDPKFAGYTFGYNRPLFAQRVHDILTVIGELRRQKTLTTLHLVGTGDAGIWVLAARALAGETISRCVADLRGFGFSRVKEANDPRLLPGGLKYGGIGGIAALAAPGELAIFGIRDVPPEELSALTQVYKVANGRLKLEPGELTAPAVVELVK